MFKEALKGLGYEVNCEYPFVTLERMKGELVLVVECHCNDGKNIMFDNAWVKGVGSEQEARLREVYKIYKGGK
jgi:hypothetical protein